MIITDIIKEGIDMRKASTKDILRTIWKEKKRFISIMMITVLGVTLMTGLKAGCRDLKLSADRFFDSQKLFDISIMSTLGLTQDDVLIIQSIEGVEKAEGTFTEIVHTKIGDMNRTAEVKMVRADGLNIPYVVEGRLPKTEKEIVVSETYLKDAGKSLGDVLFLEEILQEEEDKGIDIEIDDDAAMEEEETLNFPNSEFFIVGTVIDVMDINNGEGSAAFRATPNADYTFFVTPDALESEVYTAVYITLEGNKELLCYSLEYEKETEEIVQWIESQIMEQRQLARYQQITGEAYEKIAQKEEEMYDAFSDIEKEFAEAEEEIADSRKEIDDGWKELEDGRLELIDGRQELEDGWNDLEEGMRELEDGRLELEDGKQKLIDAEQEAKDEISKARQELEDAKIKLDEGWAKLNDAEKELNIGQAKLEDGRKELEAKEKEAKKQLEEGKQKLKNSISENKEQKKQLDSSLQEMKKMFGETWQDESSLDLSWDSYISGAKNVVLPVIAKQVNSGKEEASEILEKEIQEAIARDDDVRSQGELLVGAAMTNFGTILSELNGQKASLEGQKEQLQQALEEVLEQIAGWEGSQQSMVSQEGEPEGDDAGENEPENDGNHTGLSKEALEAKKEELEKNIEKINVSLEKLQEQINDYGALTTVGSQQQIQFSNHFLGLAIGMAGCNATEQVLHGAMTEFSKTEKDALRQIEEGWQKIYSAEKELEIGREQLSQGRQEVSDNYQKWQDGVKELEENEEKALKEIADKWQEIADGEKELLEAEQKLSEGRQELLEAEQKLREGEQDFIKGERELRDGESEWKEGVQELEDHRLEYETERAKAENKIAEAKQKVADIDMTKWYVQDRNSLSGYVNVGSDTACIESLATVFTIVFFVIAILISLTTVTRMVEEERGLIGTYKALGFTDGEILSKYVTYALGASVLGWILGDFGGFVVLPEILFVFFRVMYLIPQYILKFELISGTLGGVFFIVGIVGAAIVACYSELKHVPAHLMRPKAPKEGSRVFLEYIKPLWKRMSFLNKVTARNLFRYKKRMFMTLFGITGCTALLVFGLAIKDSVSELMPLQYDNIYRYDLLSATNAEDNEKLIAYMENSREVTEYLNLQIESVKLKNEKKESEKVQFMIFPTGADISRYFTLKDDREQPLVIENDGIYLTENASKILNLQVGDTAYIQTLDLNQKEVTIAALVKNYLGNSIYMSREAYEKVFGTYEPNGIIANLSDACEDQIAFSDRLAEEDWILSSVSTQELKATFSQAFTLINLVVYVVLVLAACLAFVVLFTLASINISERERELATIKVLGFYDKEVHSYVNKETLILTSIGILVGLPVGGAISSALTEILTMPSIYFEVTIYPKSYGIAAGIALGFAFIVQLLTDRSLDVIDPVEALKSVE